MKSKITPITLSIFKSLFAAICEEMGVALARSAFSPNIKERKDFSCALFDPEGRLVAQAAHIPVHLGSMPLSVEAVIRHTSRKIGPGSRKGGRKYLGKGLGPGDTVILNDPYQGGTHLPDITMISPVFIGKRKLPAFYIANRAHHADVGGKSPGSMPLASCLEEEGIIIPPTLFYKLGRPNREFMKTFLENVRHPEERIADLHAQKAAITIGIQRLINLTEQYGLRFIHRVMKSYREYERKITLEAIRKIPTGQYYFEDYLDDDGLGNNDIRIAATINIKNSGVLIDFQDTAGQVAGPMNAPFAVTLSAVAYVFRCLVFALTGEDCLSLEPILIKTRPGTVVHATYPAPVAGGNVETSQRIVDVLLGALSKALPHEIPAASQGTMNNMACGNKRFSYYETLGGGTGARPNAPGIDAVHNHMTNTMNTPIEALEKSLPLRITQYRIRKNSGGRGCYRGGHGLVREYEFLEPTHISLLMERRRHAPYGLKGGQSGKTGQNFHIIKGHKKKLPGKAEFNVNAHERVRIESPGGGGFGKQN